MTITMFDSIDITQMPSGNYAYAGYVAGSWPTFNSLKAKFPHSHLLSIAPHASNDADCLDVEPLDATNNQIVAWIHRQLGRGVYRPVIYSSASNMNTVLGFLAAAKISRNSVRLWSAHYGKGQHICGPTTCNLTSIAMDGTQWTDKALGRNLDESLLASNFFDPKPTPPPTPSVNWQEKMMQSLPTLKHGTNSAAVKRAQALLNVDANDKLTLDGVFGPATEAAVKAFQTSNHIPVTGNVDPQTWIVLVTGAK